MKKIILCISILFLSLLSFYFYINKNKNYSSDSNNKVIIDNIDETAKDIKIEEKNTEQEQLIEAETVTEENVIENKEEAPIVPKKETNKKVDSNKTIESTEVVDKENITPEVKVDESTNNKQEETNKEVNNVPEEKNIWDELGMSEYDYYNSPMLKWQYVTHSTFDSCQLEGENTIDDSNSGYTQYWCYEVTSFSGNFLGYMLRLIS